MTINFDKKTTGIIAVALVVGFVFGFLCQGYSGHRYFKKSFSGGDYGGMHMMRDGKMMKDGMHMSGMMKNMSMNLEGKTGDEFDKAFLTEMIMHHEGAVKMAELAKINANHQEIKNMADAIISAQNKEISDMKNWLTAWYGNN